MVIIGSLAMVENGKFAIIMREFLFSSIFLSFVLRTLETIIRLSMREHERKTCNEAKEQYNELILYISFYCRGRYENEEEKLRPNSHNIKSHARMHLILCCCALCASEKTISQRMTGIRKLHLAPPQLTF